MSAYLFIASDTPMTAVHNPHYKQLSINEAIAFGVEIPDILIKSNVNPDEPNVILWSDRELILDRDKPFDGDDDDNFGLFPLDFPFEPCDKPYGVIIEWNYFTENRAKRIIEYIKELMTRTTVVEVWHVWSSNNTTPIIKTTTICLDDLNPEHIRSLESSDHFDQKIISTHYDPTATICYCLKVTK